MEDASILLATDAHSKAWILNEQNVKPVRENYDGTHYLSMM